MYRRCGSGPRHPHGLVTVLRIILRPVLRHWKCIIKNLAKETPSIYETWRLIRCSWKPTIVTSWINRIQSPHSLIKINFNIIFPPITRCLTWSVALRFSDQYFVFKYSLCVLYVVAYLTILDAIALSTKREENKLWSPSLRNCLHSVTILLVSTSCYFASVSVFRKCLVAKH
jgi:hypothetical protein